MQSSMRFKQSESGQTLVLVALSMTVLMGFVAFAANMGLVFREQRNLQIAADAAATAGALNLRNGLSASSAAETAANQNGVTNDTLITSAACSGTGTLICVYTPPVDGPNKGSAYFVEVIVRQSRPSGLIGMFTGSTAMNVAARAVAGTPPGKGCVFALNSGVDLNFTQSGNLTFPNCNVYSDGSLSDSTSGTITANYIGLEGTSSPSDPTNITPTPTPNQSSVADPLAGEITPPTFNTSSCLPSTNVSSAGTIGPTTAGGAICYDGLNINAGNGTVTLNPGLYIINGAFNISASSSATITGTGVTFYFPNVPGNSQQNQISGGATVNLTAPTTAVTADGANIPAGILFYENPSNTNLLNISASGAATLTGIIYAPAAPLDLSGSANLTLKTALVVGSIDFTGSMNFENYAFLSGPNATTPPVLVE